MSDTKTASTDLVVLEDDLDQVAEILRGRAQVPEVVIDPAEVSADIVERILSAQGEDEARKVLESQVVHAQDVLGIPIEIHRARWAKSRFEESAVGVFALLEGIRGDTGAQIIVTCGGVFVMAEALVLTREGLLPFPVTIEATQTASKRTVLHLRALPGADAPAVDRK